MPSKAMPIIDRLCFITADDPCQNEWRVWAGTGDGFDWNTQFELRTVLIHKTEPLSAGFDV